MDGLMNDYGGIPGWIDDEVCLYQGYEDTPPTDISYYEESEKAS